MANGYSRTQHVLPGNNESTYASVYLTASCNEHLQLSIRELTSAARHSEFKHGLQERHLCATERLLPHQYLAYKASFLREAEREGPAFTRSKAKYMFRLRSPLAVKIYDFMVACNWISAPQAAASGKAPIKESRLASGAQLFALEHNKIKVCHATLLRNFILICYQSWMWSETDTINDRFYCACPKFQPLRQRSIIKQNKGLQPNICQKLVTQAADLHSFLTKLSSLKLGKNDCPSREASSTMQETRLAVMQRTCPTMRLPHRQRTVAAEVKRQSSEDTDGEFLLV